MKVVIKISREQYQEIEAAWGKEHKGYYGLPHGYGKLKNPDPQKCHQLGRSMLTDGWQWCTSKGNLARIHITADSYVYVYEGRRHALGGMCNPVNIEDCEVLQMISQTPNTPWYLTN